MRDRRAIRDARGRIQKVIPLTAEERDGEADLLAIRESAADCKQRIGHLGALSAEVRAWLARRRRGATPVTSRPADRSSFWIILACVVFAIYWLFERLR